MKIAAIDLGTNTFHLIIAEQNGTELEIIYKTNQPVKLGEDITKDNLIIPAAFERGINCLKQFKEELDQHHIVNLKATATSAVRSAINGQDFVTAAKAEAGIEIDIIDGDEEAQLIYEGVKLSGAITGKSLIMDIGGGSTEFILCDEENLIWKKSYNIGAARLMQGFFKSDPINEIDQQKIQQHVANELKALKVICEEYKPETLIGSAGAFETFAQMLLPELDIKTISTAEISFAAYQNLATKLISSSHQERAKMDNLIPLRVDMIVMATLLTNYVLNEFNINNIKLSTYDLKMGVLQSLRD
ncbi:Ppx/GppA phosphatase family protein [Pedobacter cryotolerans]|uniref:Exopolyphosphatase n=1 Tax=Pedobacter cryotolerans TaxID=2571270 RepID=A0A4U1C147_9SPHI|nr:exopolyphosphatase [Pedobacter cryotolerans]TKB99339.1 exopolyphosphatase [Pedobacter cryotolerans]